MFRGNQIHYKKDICLYILTELLINKKIYPEEVLKMSNISSHTLVRYIQSIKNALCDFNLYNINIYFDRTYKCYRCEILE